MASPHARRSTPLLFLCVLGAVACLCSHWRPLTSPVFVSSSVQGHLPTRTAVHGFKEDFDAWRSSLTPEERAMVQKQAQGEFNKKFRKSDEFKKDLPSEKVEAFSKILGKFFDNEAKDYKKELEMKTPDYDELLSRRNNKFDFSLKSSVVEIDRDADRRYRWALIKIAQAQAKGELFPNSSPMLEIHAIKNDDEANHNRNVAIVDFLKKAGEDSSCPPETKAVIDKLVKKGVPPMGEKFDVTLPQVMVKQFDWVSSNVQAVKNEVMNKTEADQKTFFDKLPEAVGGAMDEIQANCDHSKDWFKSQNTERYKTKADVIKAVWEVMPRLTGSPVPPIDDELLADLEQQPAVVEGAFRHSWGIADKLYKSEAIDAFGMKYLLGIFETKDESQKAFDEWNAKYVDARKSMADDMAQWSKQQQARLDEESNQEGVQRIRKMIQEARDTATTAR